MDQDLLTQLREYGVHHHETQQPVTVEDIHGRHEPLMATDRPTRPNLPVRRGWLFAVAVAALVIAASLPLLLLTGGNEPDVAATIASTPSTVASPPPSSVVSSTIPNDERVGREGEQLMFGVTVGGPGLVAVGATGGWVGDGDAAVWTSVDGITWTRTPHDESVFGGANSQTMWDVTAGGPGLVAVGHDGQGILDNVPDVDAAIWTSVDGDTWSRVPHDEEVFGSAWITSVTVGGPGLVAVGGTDGYWTDGDAVVWTSADGITWSRVPHDESVFGGADSQAIHDVTVGGPGLVAVGRDGGIGPWDNNADANAAVWTSVDGITWSRVAHDETVFGSGGNPSMLAVTVGGPGLVAVGADYWPSELAETPVWTSPDGINWTRAPNDVEVFGGGAWIWGVTVGGPGLIAVGGMYELGTDVDAVWTSVDGITWSRVPDDDALFGSRVFRGIGGGFMAVGEDIG